MITEHDLDEAIAECQGVRHPNANTAIMLAAFLTIKKEMFGNNETSGSAISAYSYAARPPEDEKQQSGADTVGDYGRSEFLQTVKGKSPASVFAAMDDLMSTLKTVNARAYNNVLRKIK
ncbi:MAG: hypothetical protein IKU30_06090 [Clostridia bacterium]|nr:hypothetical protein [Clostridia bacterium]